MNPLFTYNHDVLFTTDRAFWRIFQMWKLYICGSCLITKCQKVFLLLIAAFGKKMFVEIKCASSKMDLWKLYHRVAGLMTGLNIHRCWTRLFTLSGFGLVPGLLLQGNSKEFTRVRAETHSLCFSIVFFPSCLTMHSSWSSSGSSPGCHWLWSHPDFLHRCY